MHESKFLQEVMEEGRVEARRADVLLILEVRFRNSQLGDIQQELLRIRDADELRDLHRTAITCRSVAQFQRALKATPSLAK